jgi:hypothetical protein
VTGEIEVAEDPQLNLASLLEEEIKAAPRRGDRLLPVPVIYRIRKRLVKIFAFYKKRRKK